MNAKCVCTFTGEIRGIRNQDKTNQLKKGKEESGGGGWGGVGGWSGDWK